MEAQCWFYCYPEKLLCDTLHLSTHDFGAYCRALMWYYINGPLPPDEQTIRTIMGVKESEWVRCWGSLAQFFQKNGDGRWHQKRADTEITRRNELIERNRQRTLAARLSQGQSVTEPVTGSVTRSITPTERVQYNKEYERVLEKMEAIRGTYSGHQVWRKADRMQYTILAARKQELKKLLGVKV